MMVLEIVSVAVRPMLGPVGFVARSFALAGPIHGVTDTRLMVSASAVTATLSEAVDPL
jgi:hypothetical protein